MNCNPIDNENKKALKILLVNNLFTPDVRGGAEIIVDHLAQGLVNNGHEITVITTTDHKRLPNGKQIQYETMQTGNGTKFKVIRFAPGTPYWIYDRGNQPLLKKLIYHFIDLWNIRSAKIFKKLLNEIKPAIMHVHAIEGFSPSILHVASHMGIRIVCTLHAYHYLCVNSKLIRKDGRLCQTPRMFCRFYRDYYKQMLKIVNVFLSPSEFVANTHACVLSGVTRVIPNAVSPVKTSCVADPFDKKLRILFIGSIDEHKGIRFLIEAIMSLSLTNIELHVAGAGPLADFVRTEEEKDSRIHYYGFIDGEVKWDLFRTSHLLIVPSNYNDNFPTVLLEAMMCGLAVAGSKMGGIVEILESGLSGILFEPGNSQAISETIELVNSDRKLLAQMMKNSLHRSQYYSMERFIERHEDVYKSIVC